MDTEDWWCAACGQQALPKCAQEQPSCSQALSRCCGVLQLESVRDASWPESNMGLLRLLTAAAAVCLLPAVLAFYNAGDAVTLLQGSKAFAQVDAFPGGPCTDQAPFTADLDVTSCCVLLLMACVCVCVWSEQGLQAAHAQRRDVA